MRPSLGAKAKAFPFVIVTGQGLRSNLTVFRITCLKFELFVCSFLKSDDLKDKSLTLILAFAIYLFDRIKLNLKG